MAAAEEAVTEVAPAARCPREASMVPRPTPERRLLTLVGSIARPRWRLCLGARAAPMGEVRRAGDDPGGDLARNLGRCDLGRCDFGRNLGRRWA